MANIITKATHDLRPVSWWQNFIVAFYSNKGGVGKTTGSVNAAAWWANQGLRVGLLDIDGQGHVAKLLDMEPRPGLVDVIAGGHTIESQLEEAPESSWRFKRGPGQLLVLPGDIANDSIWNTPEGDDAHILRDKSVELLQADVVDLLLYDCPPSLGNFSTAVMHAAGWLVIPFIPEDLSIDGVDLALKVVRDVYADAEFMAFEDHEMPVIKVLSAIPNKVKGTVQHETLTDLVKETVPVTPPIHSLTAIAETPGFGRTIWTYAIGKNDRSTEKARLYFTRVMEDLTNKLKAQGVL